MCQSPCLLCRNLGRAGRGAIVSHPRHGENERERHQGAGGRRHGTRSTALFQRNDFRPPVPDTTAVKPLRPTVLHPRHPERICWGCQKFCAAEDLACGNGTIRTPHPSELLGDDWLDLPDSPDGNVRIP